MGQAVIELIQFLCDYFRCKLAVRPGQTRGPAPYTIQSIKQHIYRRTFHITSQFSKIMHCTVLMVYLLIIWLTQYVAATSASHLKRASYYIFLSQKKSKIQSMVSTHYLLSFFCSHIIKNVACKNKRNIINMMYVLIHIHAHIKINIHIYQYIHMIRINNCFCKLICGFYF